jgi:hypothetical protein
VRVALAGLKEAVTPDGTPEVTRLTLLLKPFCGEMVIVLEPLFPAITLRRAKGATDSVKPGCGSIIVRFT